MGLVISAIIFLFHKLLSKTSNCLVGRASSDAEALSHLKTRCCLHKPPGCTQFCYRHCENRGNRLKHKFLLVAIQVPRSPAPCSSCLHQPFLWTSARSFHVNTRHSWPTQPWLGSHTFSALVPALSECVVLRWEGGVWAATPSCCACCRANRGGQLHGTQQGRGD